MCLCQCVCQRSQNRRLYLTELYHTLTARGIFTASGVSAKYEEKFISSELEFGYGISEQYLQRNHFRIIVSSVFVSLFVYIFMR